MQKPSDLLLNVIDFLGILVPGATLVLLYGGPLSKLLGPGGSASAPGGAVDWIPQFLLAYIAGHALLGFSVPLNRFAESFPSRETRIYFDAVVKKVSLPEDLPATRANVFYAAYSYLRLHSPAALAEVERDTAEYKLFRSLTLLAAVDIFCAIPLFGPSGPRTIAAVVVLVLASARFVWLYHWSHRLAFDFYFQSLSSNAKHAPAEA